MCLMRHTQEEYRTGVPTRLNRDRPETRLWRMATGAQRVRARAASVWRQLISAAVVYALVVQAFAFGSLGGRFTATTEPGQSSPASELCLHDSTPSSPLSPVPQQGDCIHCVLCVAGGHHAFT